MSQNIRNFCIIAHIDHGKSTLADRFLELTGTVDARHMKPQYLDQLELERERGITIKMAPVRMLWHPARIDADDTRINADSGLLYKDLTYQIRGAAFDVWNKVGPGFRESVYQKSLEVELGERGINFITHPRIKIEYENKSVGDYYPDLLADNKVLVELKALPFIGDTEKKQIWSYLRGSSYRLALLINFGPKKVGVERVVYDSARNQRSSASDPCLSAQVEECVLNLIDTPGHSDFSYEVSRALAAVEGAILLVDATQGIQAQTLANFQAAKKAGLSVVGAVNKVDLNPPNLDSVVADVARLLECRPEEICRVSGKTGEGVPGLLQAVIERVPPPASAEICGNYADERGNFLRQPASSPCGSAINARALIFDSVYDDHKGIIAFVRVFSARGGSAFGGDGSFRVGEEAKFLATDSVFKIKEIGFFSPRLVPSGKLEVGEIGYIATGIKNADKLKIGDTIITNAAKNEARMANGKNAGNDSRFAFRDLRACALPGFKEPKPVVFVSLYPHEDSDYDDLKMALHRLKLNDASFTFDPDMSEVLGRGFKCGFLGRLHFEILTERLRREFNLETINSFPTVEYRVKQKGVWRIIRAPEDFPEDYDDAVEPTVQLEILTPKEYLGDILGLQKQFRLSDMTTANFGGDYVITSVNLPLSDLISDFDDKLKSVSQGYASFSYEISDERKADLTKLEILVAGEIVAGLTRIVVSGEAEYVGRQTVERLKELLPKQQFAQALQAKAFGRIVARETIPAMKKLLGNFGKTGGDRTRKMKLWKKQKLGKTKLRERGRVTISPEVFREILKK